MKHRDISSLGASGKSLSISSTLTQDPEANYYYHDTPYRLRVRHHGIPRVHRPTSPVSHLRPYSRTRVARRFRPFHDGHLLSGDGKNAADH